jgi:NADH dehydrogenase
VDDLKQLGAEVCQGDLIDPSSLKRAYLGVDRVFAAAHSLMDKGRNKSEAVDDAGHRALIDAAKAANSAHFVYMSILDASPDHPVDFWRTKYYIEEYLKASGLSYTILRPSAFMEWHVHIFNGKTILESGKTSLLGNGTKLRNFVAVRDVAQFAILALTRPELQNRTLEIGGPGNFTNNQVAEMYGKLAGITPKVSHMPRCWESNEHHACLSSPECFIMYINSLPDDAFNEMFDQVALLAVFPIDLTTLEEFIRERVAETKHQSAD